MNLFDKAGAPVQNMLLYPPIGYKNPDELREHLSRKNPKNPFYEKEYIGNAAAVEIAMDLAHQAYSCYRNAGTPQRVKVVCPRQVVANVLLVGQRSVGKTKFARALGELIGTPFAEVDGTKLKAVEQVVDVISRVCRERLVQLVPVRTEGAVRYFKLPPMTLFIDEVHALRKTMQDGLLKMFESNDRTLQTQSVILDCSRILIILGTNRLGDLSDAFKSRSTIIKLVRHSIEEVAEMVQYQYDWTTEECLAVARLNSGIPRMALDFAANVVRCCDRQGCEITHGIELMAARLGLDVDGLTSTAVEALRALAQSGTGLSKRALCATLSIEEDEFDNDILPYLMATPLHPRYVEVTNKHKITLDGMEALRQRDEASPKCVGGVKIGSIVEE